MAVACVGSRVLWASCLHWLSGNWRVPPCLALAHRYSETQTSYNFGPRKSTDRGCGFAFVGIVAITCIWILVRMPATSAAFAAHGETLASFFCCPSSPPHSYPPSPTLTHARTSSGMPGLSVAVVARRCNQSANYHQPMDQPMDRSICEINARAHCCRDADTT